MMKTILQRNGVSIGRLLNLCEIVDKGSITGAANGDPTKQSLISRQIKELEDEFGFSLIDRSIKPCALSEAGRDLEFTVRSFMNRLEKNVIEHAERNETITIAAGESVILWLLIPMLSKLPKILQAQIRFRNMQSRQAVNAVKAVRVDLAIHNYMYKNKTLSQRKISSYKMCLAVQPGLIFKTENISWDQLPKAPLIHIGGGGSINSVIDDLVLECPNGPYKFMECTSHNQVLETATQIKALAVVPLICQSKARELGLNIVNVTDFKNHEYILAASWVENNAKQSPLFRELLKAMGLGL